WTINVTNNGPDDAINTILDDILPEGLIYISDDSHGAYDNETGRWTIGDLPVGETVTITITTVVNATNTTITSDVNVSSDTYDPNMNNNKDNSSITVLPEADLEVEVLVSNATPNLNDKITWTVIVTNNGPDTAVNTQVSYKLPEGLVYNGDNSGGAYDVNTGIWNIGNLEPGQTVILNVDTSVIVPGIDITCNASVSSDTFDPNMNNNYANNSTRVPMADLELIKTVNVDHAYVGDQIIFNTEVINHGPDAAVNVIVFDNLPSELEVIDFVPSKGTYDKNTGIWTIGYLAPGEKVTLSVVTKALKEGTYTNAAFVSSDTYDPNMSNNNGSASVVIKDVPKDGNDTNVKPPVNTLPAAGNPILMVILALFSVAVVSIRKKH
ncbi:DUF11 domain-containing protein, partial [Methanobrevibacter sp.]|uniref:DUF11 domain-containing protein n=1 Tax=Methanobrevibacter sp. TaxID=66852 RepID=UPI00388D748C